LHEREVWLRGLQAALESALNGAFRSIRPRAGSSEPFAGYSPQPREPQTRDLDLAALLTRTASILLSRQMESVARKEAEQAVRSYEQLLNGSSKAKAASSG
jgi:hypothetical protein